MKLISLIILLCVLNCKNNTNLYREYLTQNSKFEQLNSLTDFYIYKDPGCGGCNVKMKKYLDTVSDIANINLIYLVKYPDNKILANWKTKYQNKLFVDKSDLLNQMNSEIIRSGKIEINDNSIHFDLLEIQDDINQFMK